MDYVSKLPLIQPGVDSMLTPVLDMVWDKYIKWAKLNKRSWKDDRSLWDNHITWYWI